MITMVSLETRSLLLRPFAPSDVEPMLAMSQEDCARKWLPSQVYRDEAHAERALGDSNDSRFRPSLESLMQRTSHLNEFSDVVDFEEKKRR